MYFVPRRDMDPALDAETDPIPYCVGVGRLRPDIYVMLCYESVRPSVRGNSKCMVITMHFSGRVRPSVRHVRKLEMHGDHHAFQRGGSVRPSVRHVRKLEMHGHHAFQKNVHQPWPLAT